MKIWRKKIKTTFKFSMDLVYCVRPCNYFVGKVLIDSNVKCSNLVKKVNAIKDIFCAATVLRKTNMFYKS